MDFKKIVNITGWVVFGIALTVYFFSVERVGSLWDVGEFVLGAYKQQVVHPPGAPLFLLIGRMFISFFDIFMDFEANPSGIAFAVNFMSSVCTAFAAMFVCFTTMILGKLSTVGRDPVTTTAGNIVLAGAGLVAGLSTAFATSIWFSAVEGEVYAMSTMFTALTLWCMVKWYHLPDTPKSDRWLILTAYVAALSIGVHLLSLLTFPALAMFYYFKKYKEHTVLGGLLAAGAGVVLLGIVQKLIIVGIPVLWTKLELLMVNGLGLPFHTGIIPTLLIVGAILYGGLRWAATNGNRTVQLLFVGAALTVVGFSTIGVVVVRANAGTPVNMNQPSDAMRLLPYINREQYGERALLYGPSYDASPVDNKIEERYGQRNGRYEIVDEKVSYEYDKSDKMLFPRMGDPSQNRPDAYRNWTGKTDSGPPTMGENISYLFRYQIGWMYWRYFMWNFSGRQNGDQGYFDLDRSSGNWVSGIGFLDEARLGNLSELPDSTYADEGWNKYFMLPFIFGLIGIFFHFSRRPKDATALLVMFIITGIGIIIYSNQPPNEPRERDYVLVGSFFTFCIWIGLAVPAIFHLLSKHLNMRGVAPAALAGAMVMVAPLLMGFQNFDDHTRRNITASRDYAANFLESVQENAIIFTYGDNDTYPLWYAQEVEGIRTDVRVVNLSLIAVDWYINSLRRQVNDSPPLKLTISEEAYRGRNRNYLPYYNPRAQSVEYNPAADQPMTATAALKFMGEDNELRSTGNRTIASFLPSKKLYMPVNREQIQRLNFVEAPDSLILNQVPLQITGSNILKDQLAIMDVVASNLWERPVYFAVTCRQDKMMGLENYMQLEGLALRIVPVRSPNEMDRYGIYGAGYVAEDITYENIMNKFKWGNFDKADVFVDRSYGPSVQSFRVVMLRTAESLMRQGDKERARNLMLKYLEAFPSMNFTYDYDTFYVLDMLSNADGYEQAKPHLEELAAETADQLEFFYSLDQEILRSSYGTDYARADRTRQSLLALAAREQDETFGARLQELFGPYNSQPLE